MEEKVKVYHPVKEIKSVTFFGINKHQFPTVSFCLNSSKITGLEISKLEGRLQVELVKWKC